MVLISYGACCNHGFKFEFPSPCGDYGSYRLSNPSEQQPGPGCFRPLAGIMVLISLIRDNNSIVYLSGFRPLAGIMVLIKNSLPSSLRPIQVSFRPLAGIMVLIGRREFYYGNNYYYVSVPLRGLWFLSSSRFASRSASRTALFPSPCGDYGSYPARIVGKSMKSKICFRPLAGIMVLIELDNTLNRVKPCAFPSPCGDYGSYRPTYNGVTT